MGYTTYFEKYLRVTRKTAPNVILTEEREAIKQACRENGMLTVVEKDGDTRLEWTGVDHLNTFQMEEELWRLMEDVLAPRSLTLVGEMMCYGENESDASRLAVTPERPLTRTAIEHQARPRARCVIDRLRRELSSLGAQVHLHNEACGPMAVVKFPSVQYHVYIQRGYHMTDAFGRSLRPRSLFSSDAPMEQGKEIKKAILLYAVDHERDYFEPSARRVSLSSQTKRLLGSVKEEFRPVFLGFYSFPEDRFVWQARPSTQQDTEEMSTFPMLL